ncbi:MAG TPA: hypothetical protein VLS96_08425 [Nodosilinea sp.]|nr:hypothetical protein [Nodosilinea sp.]
MMKLWLVCFVLLFIGAETAQWLGQLPWVSSVELSLPLTLLGGVGLAIASTTSRHWPSLGSNPPPAKAPLPHPTPAPTAAISSPAPAPQPPPQTDSISFKIKKPQRQA